MSSDKRVILDILGGTHARDGGIQQRDIAKATSTSEKTASEESAGDDAGCPRLKDPAAHEQCEADPGPQFKKGVIQDSGWT